MGKLIVIDGIDGSGKSTQSAKVYEELYKQGRNIRLISFPNYQSETGTIIYNYLHGDLGSTADSVNPYGASVLYAMDRYYSYIKSWKSFYEQRDSIILTCRYTSSNAIHQTAKLDRELWNGYIDWLWDLEFNKLELPKPDLVLYLDLKPEISFEMTKKRQAETGQILDIHEKDEDYLIRCSKAGTYVANKLGWKKIQCYEEKEMLSEDLIKNMLLEEITLLLDTKGGYDE